MLSTPTLTEMPSGDQLRAVVRDRMDVLRVLCRTGDARARQRLGLARTAMKSGDLRAAFEHLVASPRVEA
jgi:hypothetical protein